MQWQTKSPNHHLWIAWILTSSGFHLKDQDVTKQDQYCKIVYLLDTRGIEALKSFTWEDNTEKIQSPQQIWEQFPNTQHAV